jgi:HSP20 family protein
MGIMDRVTALLPRREEREDAAPVRAEMLALRDDFDDWFESFFQWTPATSLHETDDEVVVMVEVPGLDREDLQLSITPDGLVVRGEKRDATQDRRKDLHVSEVRYGSFSRIVPLPPGLDAERAQARVKNGVLTVTFPKSREPSGARRIPIKS